MLPVYVFVPDKVSVPEPAFVSAPEPLIIPWILEVVELATFMVPAPVIVTPLFALNVMFDVVNKLPPLKVILSTSAEPGADPKLLSFEIDNTPVFIVVLPL